MTARPFNRKAANSRLWGLVRSLPGGQQTLRDLVAILRQEDRSGKELAGTAAYCSTRLLSDGQFARLLAMVEEKVPGRPRRRRCMEGNVVWLLSGGERRYVSWLARALGWKREVVEEFIAKQTQGRGMKQHKDASAVIEPMERMLRERGWGCEEQQGKKWWTKPGEVAC